MKILIFIGLKTVEIAAIVFVPYYMGKLLMPFIDKEEQIKITYWMIGLGAIILACLLVFWGYLLVTANWEWAGKLIEKQ